MHTYEEYKNYINKHLTDYIPELNHYASTLREAMVYSLECGGKRLRPVMLLASCEAFGGNIEEALPYACALEYIHTYSLIHDDLPAMDNDDYRRGKLTNHKVYGDAVAILAGDALLNTAAEIMFNEALAHSNDYSKFLCHVNAGRTIINRAGINGMIAGQLADVENELQLATAEMVDFIEANKTGALIAAPIIAGLQLAGEIDAMKDFTEYAEKIGQAFQISDDILDIEGDPALLGKTLGKDADEGKCNYAYVHGIDAAKRKLHELTVEAQNIIKPYGERADYFTELAERLENRDK